MAGVLGVVSEQALEGTYPLLGDCFTILTSWPYTVHSSEYQLPTQTVLPTGHL